MVARNEINRGHREVDAVHLPTATLPAQVEVLVVGAGPSGLSAALELDRHGVDVAVVDAATSFTLARAGAMSHTSRVAELFDQWGVLDRLRRGWTFPPEWNVGTLVRTSLAGHDLVATPRRQFAKRPGNPYSFKDGIRRPQTAVQQAFLDEIASRGIPVTGGHRVEGLVEIAADDNGPDGVLVTTRDTATGTTRQVRARYAVGADGSRSTVRQLAGIEREGEYAGERNYRFVVRVRGGYAGISPVPSGTNVIVNDIHSGFLAALNETDWRAYTGPYPLGHEPSEADLLELAHAAFGADVDLEVLDVTGYYKSTRIASTFRKDRVLLVGDAAHVRTPGGNLGEGFGDVANLGWKLAAVLRGYGGDSLLDSYDQERRPHNWRVAAYARERSLATEQRVAQAREVGFPADDDLSEEAHARRVRIGEILRGNGGGPTWGVTFDERYDDSTAIWYDDDQAASELAWDPAVYVPSGRPGHRAPNGNLDPYGGTIYDRLGSHAALLVLAEDDAGVAAFEAAAEARGIELEVIHLPDAEARELYGASYALIRPDHHVGWRGEDVADAGAVLDRVYGRDASQAGVVVGREAA